MLLSNLTWVGGGADIMEGVKVLIISVKDRKHFSMILSYHIMKHSWCIIVCWVSS